MNQKPVIGIVAGFEPGLGSPGVGMFAESADSMLRSVVLAGGVPVLLPVTGETPDAQSVALIDGLFCYRAAATWRPICTGRTRSKAWA